MSTPGSVSPICLLPPAIRVGLGCGCGSNGDSSSPNGGGGPWQATRMTAPDRAARLGLVVAVATCWLVSVGGEAEAQAPDSACAALASSLPTQARQRQATRLRLVAVFQQGLIRLVLAMLDHAPLPCGQFFPEPWPTAPPLTITDLPEETAPQ